jgi:hypothetical protein
MPKPVWMTWEKIPARSWVWVGDSLYFGDDSGHIYEMHPRYQSDLGPGYNNPILVDVQMAWSQYKTPGIKHFKMVRPYLLTDGDPRPQLDMKVDYDSSVPLNTPDISFAQPGATWDVSDWDADYWAIGGERAVSFWQGVGALGRVGGPRLRAQVMGCSFGLAGWDVLYESGAAV